MGLTRWSARGRTRAVIVLTLLLALAAAVDGWQWWRSARWNELIQADPVPPEAAGEPLELRFARAHAQAESGALQEALNGYRALQGESPLGQAARFNSANLLVRQAIAQRATAQPGQAIALLELAKETYREVLRHDPEHWDARYNLERAQRLLPDADDTELEPAAAPRARERAATTMRAYSPGLP
jgi:mxaK protein